MKRVAGASGRMRKNEEGEWEWSDDADGAEDGKPKATAAVSVSVSKMTCNLLRNCHIAKHCSATVIDTSFIVSSSAAD